MTASISSQLSSFAHFIAEGVSEYGPFIKLFENKVEKLSIVTLHAFLTIFSMMKESVGCLSGRIVRDIGQAVEREFHLHMLSNKKNRDLLNINYRTFEAILNNQKLFDLSRRRLQSELQANQDSNLLPVLSPWPLPSIMKLGSCLATMFMRVAHVPVMRDNPNKIAADFRFNFVDDGEQLADGNAPPSPPAMLDSSLSLDSVDDVVWEPAYKHGYHFANGKKMGVIECHEAVANVLLTSMDRIQHASLSSAASSELKDSDNALQPSTKVATPELNSMPKMLPMLIPPKPWFTWDSGGYLTIKSIFMTISNLQDKCMRSPAPDSDYYLIEASRSGALTNVLAALDCLGMTSWRVNSAILDLIVKAWNHEIELPPKTLPPPFKVPEPIPPPVDIDTNINSKRAWQQAKRKQKQHVFNMQGLRATENYKLEIALALKDRPLYFPHYMDFRGRAYPFPPHFNHLGNDMARSLLIFDVAKPLGPDGLNWLKIHLANMYGIKDTFDGRLQFVDSHMDEVRSSALDPFGVGIKCGWWKQADKPWMTLSVCMELVEALESPNPELFESRIPVHQDGSCNGLQHYAALGGDLDGAKQVNLRSNQEQPQDVYSAVADKVKEMMRKDMEIPVPGTFLHDFTAKIGLADISNNQILKFVPWHFHFYSTFILPPPAPFILFA